MVELNKVRYSGRKTKTGVLHKAVCDLCGTITLRWEDEKVKCKYCGVSV